MDTASENGHQPEDPADLVVIDRGVLRQTLTAVVSTLKSAASLEQLRGNPALDEETHSELIQQVEQARTSLVDGIEMMLKSLNDLPSVNLKQED